MPRVLIIEDNETNLYMMKFILTRLECEVLEARDGESGVALALSERPDLILMDIQLPVLDGYAATRRLREEETTREIPIIAVTSFAMAGDREKAMEAGCTAYVEKPIDPEMFIREISKYLQDK